MFLPLFFSHRCARTALVARRAASCAVKLTHAHTGAKPTPPEADAFARAPPGVFPDPQFVADVAAVGASGGTGIALLGDAAHAFPPDVGQGVNAALEVRSR